MLPWLSILVKKLVRGNLKMQSDQEEILTIPSGGISDPMEASETTESVSVLASSESSLWEKCQQCNELVFSKTLIRNFYTCPYCQCNNALPNQYRIEQILNSVEYTYVPTKQNDDPSCLATGLLGSEKVVVLSGLPQSVDLALQAFEIVKEKRCPFIVFLPDIQKPRIQYLSAIDLTLLTLEQKQLKGLLCITVLTSPDPRFQDGFVSQEFSPNFPMGDILIVEKAMETEMVPPPDNGLIDRVSSRQELSQILMHLVNWSSH